MMQKMGEHDSYVNVPVDGETPIRVQQGQSYMTRVRELKYMQDLTLNTPIREKKANIRSEVRKE